MKRTPKYTDHPSHSDDGIAQLNNRFFKISLYEIDIKNMETGEQ